MPTLNALIGSLKRLRTWMLRAPSIGTRRVAEDVPFSPVNYQPRDPSEIQTDVQFSINSAQLILGFMGDAGLRPQETHFLELGPGTHFGAPLVLASMGIRVTVADRFLARWQEGYHPALYRELRKAWQGPKDAIEAALDANGYPSKVITLLEEPAEALCSIQPGTVDFTYSNAVLEHVTDMGEVAREMARVMRPGAIGAHQVDMRHHDDFSRPLEHIIMSEEEYTAEVAVNGYERGNRLRPSEFIALFENHGLEVTHFDANCQAESSYLATAIQRLRASSSRYRNWPDHDLSSVGGRFFLARRDAEAFGGRQEAAGVRLATYAALKSGESPQ